MKKTITMPDGSTQTIEGTADELAEYERKLKNEAPKKEKKKKILNEQRLATDDVNTCQCGPCGIQRMFGDLFKKSVPQVPWVDPYVTPIPIYPQPFDPWPGYPQPYVGDMPGWLVGGQTTTSSDLFVSREITPEYRDKDGLWRTASGELLGTEEDPYYLKDADAKVVDGKIRIKAGDIRMSSTRVDAEGYVIK